MKLKEQALAKQDAWSADAGVAQPRLAKTAGKRCCDRGFNAVRHNEEQRANAGTLEEKVKLSGRNSAESFAEVSRSETAVCTH